MQIQKPGNLPSPSNVQKPAAGSSSGQAASLHQDQMELTPAQSEAFQVMQQMVQARLQLGEKLIQEVIEPSPAEFQQVAQLTMPLREQGAVALAQQAEQRPDPSMESIASSAYYLLAAEAKTLAQATINAEKRAEFQEQSGQIPQREELVKQEVGLLVEAGVYQSQFPPEQLQQMLSGPIPEGEQGLSAGAFVEVARQSVPPEAAQQIEQLCQQAPLVVAFRENPEMSRNFATHMKQNVQAAESVNAGCLGYFAYLGEIAQRDFQAAQVLLQGNADLQG